MKIDVQQSIVRQTSTQTVIVPIGMTGEKLIATAERQIGLTYRNKAYTEAIDLVDDSGRRYQVFNQLVYDECGKTYEVAKWKPGRRVSSEWAENHLEGLDPSNPYRGNTTAFIVWLTLNQPEGWYVTIPEKARLLRNADGGLCAPLFGRGSASRDLGLREVAGDWDAGDVFVAFREVVQPGALLLES